MQVCSMVSNKGNNVPNQFIIHGDNLTTYFQSYESIIVKQDMDTTPAYWL